MSDQLELIDVPPALDISGQVIGSAESDEFYTPSLHFNLWHREFDFTLDAAATKESAKCASYFSKDSNGLAQSWGGERVWVNPPYSAITPWIIKSLQSVHPVMPASFRAKLVAMLVPAWTDRAWWQDFVEPNRDGHGLSLVQTRFLKRIRFGTPLDPEGVKSGSPAFWPVLLVWRPRT